MKRPALQKRVGVLGTAFRARKVFGTFEKRATGEKMKIDREDQGLASLFHTYLLTERCSLLSSGNHLPYHFPLNIVFSFFLINE